MAATNPRQKRDAPNLADIPGRREEVFRAWTDPKALERWFAPDPEFS